MKKKEQTALQTMTDKQYQDALAVFTGEWSRKVSGPPEIRVSYEADTKQKFYIKKGDKPEILGDNIEVIILKSRNQYSLYAENKDERLSTDEFDSFKDMVTLRKGGEAIMTAPYPEVKAIIKEKYPEMKFINVLYVMLKPTVATPEEKVTLYKIYIKPASRQNLWDFQASTGPKASFSFVTKLGTTVGKKGATTFYPITFEKGEDMTPEAFRSFMAVRMDLDRDLKAQEETAAKIAVYEEPTENIVDGEVVPF